MKATGFPHLYLYLLLGFACLVLGLGSFLLIRERDRVGRLYGIKYSDWVLSQVRLRSYVERVDEHNEGFARQSLADGDTAVAVGYCKDVCFRTLVPFCDTVLALSPRLAETVFPTSHGVHEAVCASFNP